MNEEPFDWKAWQADSGLRSCSLAAKGLWMELLCIMAQNKSRRGVLEINGKIPTREVLAKMTGAASVQEFCTLAKELKDAGVPTEVDGLWCNRRMYDKTTKRSLPMTTAQQESIVAVLPPDATEKQCLEYLCASHIGFKTVPDHAVVGVLHTYASNLKLRAEIVKTFALHHAGNLMPTTGTLVSKLDGYLRNNFQNEGGGTKTKTPDWKRLEMLKEAEAEFIARHPHPDRWTEVERNDMKQRRAEIARLKTEMTK